MASGFVTLARGPDELIELGRAQRETGLPGGPIDCDLRPMRIAFVTKSLRAPRDHQRAAIARLHNFVDDGAHATALIYLVR
jgi:hypothetical protein